VDIQEHGPRETPLRRLTITVFMLIVLATILSFANDSDLLSHIPRQQQLAIDWVFCIVWFACGAWLIRRVEKGIFRMVSGRTKLDNRVATLWSRAFSAMGYAFVLVIALHLLHIRVGSILVGGAVTGVLVGIGAQSTLSNLFAGLVLFTVRPFSVGQTVTLRTYLFSGMEYSGTVSDINWYYTVLVDGSQRRLVPNSAVIASAITIVSELPSTQLFTIPLPYNLPVSTFKQRIQEVFNGDVDVSIKDFGEDNYSVQIRIPETASADDLREAITRCRERYRQ
jgi:small conductance mechanosensitive channel